MFELWNGKPRQPKQIAKRRERQHLNSGTDNNKMVVLEACAIRRKAEPGGNSGEPLEATRYLGTVPGKREEISGEVT